MADFAVTIRRRVPWRLTAVLAAALALGAALAVGRAHVGQAPDRGSLPLRAGERLLVNSHEHGGIWLVDRSGTASLVSRTLERGTLSPDGRLVAAVGAAGLTLVDLRGHVRWRRAFGGGGSDAAWSSDGALIAYTGLAGLRIAGRDTGDRLVARWAIGPFAWRPGTRELAFVEGGLVTRLDADSGVKRHSELPLTTTSPQQLLWTADGAHLVAVLPHELVVLARDGSVEQRVGLLLPAIRAAASPTSGEIAVQLQSDRGQPYTSEIRLVDVTRAGPGRALYRGPGTLAGVQWSPDGTSLVTAARERDAWIYLDPAATTVRTGGPFGAQFPRADGQPPLLELG